MKAVFVAMFLVGLVAAGIGAGTWAYFSDTETSSGNYIAAGTLDLKLGDGESTWYDDPNIPDYTVSDVYPGWGDWLDFYAKNFGSISGDLYMKVTYTERGGDNPEAEGSPDDAVLDDNLYVAVYVDGTLLNNQTLSWWASQGYYSLGSLTAGSMAHIKIEVYIPTTVGNEIQGDTVTIDVEFKLMQNGYSP